MAQLFDRAHFNMMTGDDAALQTEIVGLFREQVAKWAPLLIAETPAQECKDVAHTLKGSARGLGLWRLAEACAHAETVIGSAYAKAALTLVQCELRDALGALDSAIAKAA